MPIRGLGSSVCGRAARGLPADALAARFDAEAAVDLPPRYNVAPRDRHAVLGVAGADRLTAAEWGLDAFGGDPRPINARADRLDAVPAFREAAAERRCLVLATGFYEWPGNRKPPHFVRRTDGEPFAMAGVYAERDGVGEPTTAVLTTPPNAVVEPLHDRMAAILPRGEERAWLDADSRDRWRDLLRPHDPAPFEAHEVSTAVNDPSAEGRELTEPLDTTQAGFDAFG
jgi:putative SOS response-associated peptidase YedK